MPLDGRRKASKIASTQFASVIHAYLNSPKFLSHAPATRELWGRMLRLAAREDILGAVSVEEIRPKLVQCFLDGLSNAPSAQVAARAALKRLEAWAIVREQLVMPVTFGTEVIGSDGGHEPWTPEQVSLAEKHCRQELSRTITLAVNTGQRGSDLVKMHWTDLETYHGRPGINVTQKKTGKRLWIPMTEELQKAIGGWQKRMGTILVKTDGAPFERKQLTDMWTYERETNKEIEPLMRAGLVLHGLRASALLRSATRRGERG
jgi:integrase